MNTKIRTASYGALVALSLSTVFCLAGCGEAPPEENELLANPATPETISSEGPSYPVEREFWLALAEEPRWHLNAARDFFLNDDFDLASIEMAKAASILNFECRHSHSPREEGLLLGSVEELREVARDLRFQNTREDGLVSLKEMDRVAALAYRSIAAHQVSLARDALLEGDARTAGALSRETAQALNAGFQRSGVEKGHAMAEQLQHAREVGLKMQLNGEGSREEGLVALDQLDGAVEALGNVVTERRR